MIPSPMVSDTVVDPYSAVLSLLAPARGERGRVFGPLGRHAYTYICMCVYTHRFVSVYLHVCVYVQLFYDVSVEVCVCV